MHAKSEQPAAPAKKFTISRTLDAPRDLVWKAWTQRDRVMQWFGPKGFKMTTANLDFRPGGTFHYCVESPEGHKVWGKCIYREIKPQDRIVLIQHFSDEKGGITTHPMSPTWPREMHSTTTFTESHGKTTVTVEWYPINATQAEMDTFNTTAPGMTAGWTGTFEQLVEYLKHAHL